MVDKIFGGEKKFWLLPFFLFANPRNIGTKVRRFNLYTGFENEFLVKLMFHNYVPLKYCL